MTTNLGLAGAYRVRLPNHFPDTVLFGVSTDYRGERGPLELASLLAKRCTAFVDVGAHIGYFIFYLRSRAVDVPIYYFEPSQVYFGRLSENLSANNIKNVTGFEAAVGARDGEAEFFLDLSDPSSSSLTDYYADRHETERVRVTLTTFDSFVEAHSLADMCVKVDVENAEFDFVRGASNALLKIKYLIMEVIGPADRAGFVGMMIREKGMHAYYINDFRLEYSADGAYTYVEPEFNWLFCREAPDELRETLKGSRFLVME